MTLTNLKLVQFRNHTKASFDFADGVNLIVGENGAGKTNILEAIHLLATGKSFRAHYDMEMIHNNAIGLKRSVTNSNDGNNFSRILGTISTKDGPEALEITILKNKPDSNLSQKTFKINGTPKPVYKAGDYFSTVLFCPQDLDLFNGSPALRRKFLDDVLCKIDQKYKKEHTSYTRAVRQRNKVLEKISKIGRGNDELPFWTEEILKTGTYIQESRTELIKTLNAQIGETYSEISSQLTDSISTTKSIRLARTGWKNTENTKSLPKPPW